MAAVPHSGNNCSGMCVAPCGHEGCWQCHDIEKSQGNSADQRAAKKIAAKKLRINSLMPSSYDKTIQELVQKELEAGLLSKMDAQQIVASGPGASPTFVVPPRTETAPIPRAVLEGLVSQVPGLTVDWNNGDPIFHRTQDAKAVDPAVYFPKPVRRDEAKAHGASDADIEAAEKVLRSMPGEAETVAWKAATGSWQGDPMFPQPVDPYPDAIRNQVRLQQALDNLKI